MKMVTTNARLSLSHIVENDVENIERDFMIRESTSLSNSDHHRRKPRRRKLHACSVESLAYYTLSRHAQMRAAQRGLSRQDIDYTLRYGELYHTCGVASYFLRDVDIPIRDHRHMKRLEGAIVIVALDRPLIITVLRNRLHGSRNIRHQLAQIWRRERRTMG